MLHWLSIHNATLGIKNMFYVIWFGLAFVQLSERRPLWTYFFNEPIQPIRRIRRSPKAAKFGGGRGGGASGSGNKYSEDCTEQTEKSIITTILYFTCAVIDIMLTLQTNVNKPKLSKNPLSLPLAHPTNVGRTQHKS